jgi:hypothetical protein
MPTHMDRSLCAVLFLLLAACAASGSGATITGIATNFDSEEPGRLPAGFQAIDTSSGDDSSWQVLAGGAQGPAGQSLGVDSRGSRGERFHLLLTEQPCPPDLRLSVKLRADGGKEDQGGGLVWRAQSATDYCIARWNPLEDNVRIYTVAGGERNLLQSAKVSVPPGQWHELSVTADGDHMTVSFDGKVVLDVHDGTFTGRGMAGLWTKADARTLFDDLSVESLRPAN